VFSGSVHDEVLRETGAITATHAFAEGFFGPCGIDAFTIETEDNGDAPRETLRPLVEFNARFTMGTIAIGIVRRALETIKEPLGLTPGTRCAFYFGLNAPEAGWEPLFENIAGKKCFVPLWHPADELKPAILFAESCEALDEVVAAARLPKPKRKASRKPTLPQPADPEP
jgi:hypothetical protein